MEPVARAIRMNPFAVKVLQSAVESMLERAGCRDWAVEAGSGDVEAGVTVESRESRFLFRLKNPFSRSLVRKLPAQRDQPYFDFVIKHEFTLLSAK